LTNIWKGLPAGVEKKGNGEKREESEGKAGENGENGGKAAATMTLNEPVYGVRVAKVKQEIKARISTLKRRRRRQGNGKW